MPARTHSGDKQRLHETNSLIFGVFGCLILTQMITWLPRDLFGSGLNDFVYTEWLIDYSAGFVRRGLSGEITRLLSIFLPTKFAVGSLIWGLFIGLAAAYIRLLRRSLDRIGPTLLVGLLFLPSLLPFSLYDHGAFGRKENFGFLILLWHLYLLESLEPANASAYIKQILPVSLVALPIHLLIHEASLLQFVPVHLLISHAIIRSDPSVGLRRRVLILILIYSPAFLTFSIICLFGRPTYEVAIAICRHWESLGALPAGSAHAGEVRSFTLPGALEGLSWSFAQGTAMSRSLSRLSLIYWGALFLVFGLCTAWIGSLVTEAAANSIERPKLGLAVLGKASSRKLLLKYFLLPLLLSLPLYLVGWDFGRWFVITCVNYILITLSPEVSGAEVRDVSDQAAECAPRSSVNDTPPFSVSFYCCLGTILLVIFFLRIPNCCVNASNMFAEPIRSSLEKIAKPHPG